MDSSYRLLLPYLQGAVNRHARTLWVADENALETSLSLPADNQLQVISNRFDVYQNCLKHSQACQYSDYDFSQIPEDTIDTIIYRVSKERPVVHHVINEALRILKPDGQLVLCGEKQEGAKTAIDKAGKLFGHKTRAEKHGTCYLASVCKKSLYNSDNRLDDKHYTEIRQICTLNDIPVLSKPGLYGWEKQDQGSALLMDTADNYFNFNSGEHLHKPTVYPSSLLDLGCGYGYLTLRTAHWQSVERRVATDNNAAAIHCATLNFAAAKLDVTTVADDCAANIDERFDAILCNPPFHQGFSLDGSLTDKFLRNSARHLNKRGVALFVVNQFIALEKKANAYFDTITLLANDQQFKVIALSNPKS